MTPEEFQREWEKCSADIFGFLLRQFRDQQLAEDAYQNTHLRCTRACEQFEGRGTLKAWLLTVARNEGIRFKRQNARQVPSALVEDMPAGDTEPTADDVSEFAQPADPEETFSPDQEAEQAIEAALKAEYISAEEAEILRARIAFSPLKLNEICASLGIRPGTGAARHLRGELNLRIFYFVERPKRLGGRQIILAAFAAAQTAAINPLTEDEARVFKKEVLDRKQAAGKKVPLSELLRKACAKIALQLSRV